MACVSNVKQRLRAPREHALTRNQPLVDGPVGDAWQKVPPPPAGSLGRQTCKVWLRPPGAGATVHGNDVEQSVPRLRSTDRRRCMIASRLRSTRLFSNGTRLVASSAYPRCDMYCTARCRSVAHTVGLASLRASALLGKCASLTWAVFFSSILALYAANRVDIVWTSRRRTLVASSRRVGKAKNKTQPCRSPCALRNRARRPACPTH